MPLISDLHNGLNTHALHSWSTVRDFFNPSNNMPSFKSALVSGLSAQTVLDGTSPNKPSILDTHASASCPNAQLSCHNTTMVDNLCCFNAPGGSLLQTQFWDTHPATGPEDSWTIHGLWPDNCDGTYDANCDDRRAYRNITAILREAGATDTLDAMQTYWKDYNGDDETFWQHEWSKHGTCISTLAPSCYKSYNPTEEVPDFFNRTVSLFSSLPSYDWLSDAGIVPSTSKTYTAAEIQAALSLNHEGHQVRLGCRSGQLNEIWYFFNVRGSLQTGDFVPASPDKNAHSCPSTGIRYLPKNHGNGDGGGGHTPTTTTTATAAPTSTLPPFTAKGFLDVIPTNSNGRVNGCLISGGKWYTTGTCATYTAYNTSCPNDTDIIKTTRRTSQSDNEDHDNDENNCFTFHTSRGFCAFSSSDTTTTSSSGALTCTRTMSEPAIFAQEAGTGKLVYQGIGVFGADAVPEGIQKGDIFSEREGHEVGVEIVWRGAGELTGGNGEVDVQSGTGGLKDVWVLWALVVVVGVVVGVV